MKRLLLSNSPKSKKAQTMINSIFDGIQLTMEMKKWQESFLTYWWERRITELYRKPTRMIQTLSLYGSHQKAHKTSCVQTLSNRANTKISKNNPKQEKKEAEEWAKSNKKTVLSHINNLFEITPRLVESRDITVTSKHAKNYEKTDFKPERKSQNRR